MPSNIVVKKADGTTDVTYTAVAGASGDSPAVFRSATQGTVVAEQPSLLIRSQDNSARTARRITCDFSWPVMAQDAGGNKVVAGRANGSCTLLVPLNQPASVIAEQAAQYSNLIGSAVVKAAFTTGYAPN